MGKCKSRYAPLRYLEKRQPSSGLAGMVYSRTAPARHRRCCTTFEIPVSTCTGSSYIVRGKEKLWCGDTNNVETFGVEMRRSRSGTRSYRQGYQLDNIEVVNIHEGEARRHRLERHTLNSPLLIFPSILTDPVVMSPASMLRVCRVSGLRETAFQRSFGTIIS